MVELAGRVAVVTGANSGVGRSTTELLAKAGARVVMVCRDRGRGEKALAAVRRLAGDDRAELEIADLSSFESVRGLTDRLSARFDRIEMLVNNAGVFRARRELSVDGFEVTLATNHLGHYLLTVRLMDLLRRGRARIVNVSSNGHRRARLRRAPLAEIFRGTDPYSGIVAYGDSKLANVLFTRELARRWGGDGVLAFAVHPGVLATEIWDRNSGLVMRFLQWWKRFMDPPSVGGEAVSRLVLDPDVASLSGGYFDELEPARPSADALDDGLARSLWEESLGAVEGQTPRT